MALLVARGRDRDAGGRARPASRSGRGRRRRGVRLPHAPGRDVGRGRHLPDLRHGPGQGAFAAARSPREGATTAPPRTASPSRRSCRRRRTASPTISSVTIRPRCATTSFATRPTRRPGWRPTSTSRSCCTEMSCPRWIRRRSVTFSPTMLPETAVELRLGSRPVERVGPSLSLVHFRLDAGAPQPETPRGTVGWVKFPARPRHMQVIPAGAVLESPEGPYVLVIGGDRRSASKRPDQRRSHRDRSRRDRRRPRAARAGRLRQRILLGRGAPAAAGAPGRERGRALMIRLMAWSARHEPDDPDPGAADRGGRRSGAALAVARCDHRCLRSADRADRRLDGPSDRRGGGADHRTADVVAGRHPCVDGGARNVDAGHGLRRRGLRVVVGSRERTRRDRAPGGGRARAVAADRAAADRPARVEHRLGLSICAGRSGSPDVAARAAAHPGRDRRPRAREPARRRRGGAARRGGATAVRGSEPRPVARARDGLQRPGVGGPRGRRRAPAAQPGTDPGRRRRTSGGRGAARPRARRRVRTHHARHAERPRRPGRCLSRGRRHRRRQPRRRCPGRRRSGQAPPGRAARDAARARSRWSRSTTGPIW